MLLKIKNNEKYKGMVFLLLSAFCYSIMTVLLKYVTGVTSIQKCLVRNVITVLIAIFIVGKHKVYFVQNTKKNIGWLLFRGICGTASMILYYYAVDRMLVANLTMISMTAPFFCVLVSAIFLKEKVRKYHMIALLIAFFGILIVVRPGAGNTSFPINMAALLNAVFSAVGLVATRVLGKKNVDPGIVLLIGSVIGIIAALVLNGTNEIRIGMRAIIFLIVSGAIGGIGNYFVTLAYKYAPSKEISILDYSQIIFSMILGIVLFGEFPEAINYAGYVLVIAAAGYMFIKTKQETKLT